MARTGVHNHTGSESPAATDCEWGPGTAPRVGVLPAGGCGERADRRRWWGRHPGRLGLTRASTLLATPTGEEKVATSELMTAW